MRIEGKSVVVTGGASGIGRALARRFHTEGARGVALADLQEGALREAAGEIDGLAVPCNVADEADIGRLVAAAEDAFGAIDVFVSNAGIARMGGVDAPDEEWRQNWDIHVMAHVYAARAVASKMAARGSGYLVNTASAAGLLGHVESATYSVTKHAAIAFAEWLSIAYGERGVRVSVLCPQAVRTAMLAGRDEGVASLDGVLEPEQVAECVIEAMAREDFLILPHPEVQGYMERKTADHARWLRGMRRLRAAHEPAPKRMVQRLSRAEAHARLVGPGLPFELEEIEVRGVAMRAWKNAPPSLAAILAASADYGERAFLAIDDERLSFAAHHRLVCRFAAALRARYGVGKGDRVAIAMRNLPEWSVAFWAAAALGAIAVPLNAWLVGRELAYCVVDSGSCVVVADGRRADLLASCDRDLGLRGMIVVRGEGGTRGDTIAPWDDVLTAAPAETPPPRAAIAPDDDATIFYTSGTTGEPKGAVGTHRNICSNIMTVAYRGAVRQLGRGVTPVWLGGPVPHSTTLVPVPFFHVTGCHAIMAPALFGGSTLILMHRWDPEQALALVERERITNITGVPGMVLQMLESPHFADRDTSSLVAANYGGTPPPPRLPERIAALLPQVEAENGYGLTEASSIVSYNAGESYRRHPDGAGRPTPICDIRIVDEAGADAPAGVRGEVCVKGPNIVRGYWNRPEESAVTFRDGWLHTGDIGRLDEEGHLFLLDRAKDMLIRGGENVYCVEVENALCSHPAVMDAAVIGRPHPVLGQEVAAVVRAVPGQSVGEGALIEHCRTRLAAFKVPVAIDVRVEPLPVNASGKVMKRQLQDEMRAPSGDRLAGSIG